MMNIAQNRYFNFIMRFIKKIELAKIINLFIDTRKIEY